MLLAFRAPLPDLKGKEPPKRLLVGKWGKNDSAKGAFVVNESTAKYLPTVQRMLARDTVAIDFEHNTVPGTVEFEKPEPKKVAGHGVPRVVPGEGLFIEEIRWTPEGDESIRGGHHPDLSPAIKTNSAGEVVFIDSAALTRNGAAMDLRVFSEALSAEQLKIFSAAISQPPTQSTMDYKALLLALLALQANASDTDIAAAAKTFGDNLKSVLGQAESLKTLSADFGKMKEKLEGFEKSVAKSERESITAAALAAGKLVPHGAAIDALDNAAFKAIVDGLQAGVVPLEKRTPELVKTHSVQIGNNDGSADEVRRHLKISDESWKKHDPAKKA
jgi:phage I-like protein